MYSFNVSIHAGWEKNLFLATRTSACISNELETGFLAAWRPDSTRHGTEVAFLLLTKQLRVQISPRLLGKLNSAYPNQKNTKWPLCLIFIQVSQLPIRRLIKSLAITTTMPLFKTLKIYFPLPCSRFPFTLLLCCCSTWRLIAFTNLYILNLYSQKGHRHIVLNGLFIECTQLLGNKAVFLFLTIHWILAET